MQIEFRSASVISACLHAGVLAFALFTFSGSTLDAKPPDSMPIDLVSVNDFSKMMKGAKEAPKADKPKPLVEKKADEQKTPDDIKAKVDEKKKPIETAKAEPTPPPEPKTDPIAEKLKQPPPPTAEPKPDDKADKKPEPKPEPKPQQKADAKPQKVDKLPPRKPPEKPQPKFDADKIAALLDKREAKREAATGSQLNNAATLGSANGADAQLSQSEIDALRARLRQCWNPPVGASDVQHLEVVFRVLFKRDGAIAYEPQLVRGTASQFGPALAESAKRALLQCQPYKMLKPEHYEQWKDMEITFDPRDMFGGG
jgi:colicin import membrane protein